MEVFKGQVFEDARGKLIAFNDFSMDKVKRMYQIYHPNTSIVRAWQGHKLESKWFYVVEGAFVLAYVCIDDFLNPSKHLSAIYHMINAEDKIILNVPCGYANGLKSIVPNSKILVFSDMNLESAKDDSFKYDSHYWLNWHQL